VWAQKDVIRRYTSKADSAPVILKRAWKACLYAAFHCIRAIERKTNDHRYIRRRAKRLYDELETSITLKDFAERLDVTVGYLEYPTTRTL